jgi:hypothetical protein
MGFLYSLFYRGLFVLMFVSLGLLLWFVLADGREAWAWYGQGDAGEEELSLLRLRR